MTPDIPTKTDDLQIPAEQWPAVAQRVRAFYASDRTTHATGVAVSYADRPTVAIRQDDGRLIHWVADLCEPIADKPDSPPPGGSGIARKCTTHHACDCREAAYEETADDRDRYKAWLQEANTALNAAGRSTYRDDAANLDLAERIKTLTTERDEAEQQRQIYHDETGRYRGQLHRAHEALRKAGLHTTDGNYRADNAELPERIKRLADERNEAHAGKAEAHRLLDEAGVARMFDLADRVQALIEGRASHGTALAELNTALGDYGASVWEDAIERVRALCGARADGVTHVHHHDPEDHAASYNEGYADGERHAWGELLGWVSDHMLRIGEA